jgi:hypothetical protein
VFCHGSVRRRPCVPGFDRGCARLDLAGRRTGAAAVLRRSGPVRGRPAPRHRHRRRARPRGACTRRRDSLLRRLRARRWPVGHDHDRRRLRRDVAPAQSDERRARHHRHGGDTSRRGWREQRRSHPPAARSPRRARCRRPERIRRPARPIARAAAAAAGGRSTRTRGGSSGRSACDCRPADGGCRGGSCCGIGTPTRATPRVTVGRHRRSARREPVCPAGRRQADGDAAELRAIRRVQGRALDEVGRGSDVGADICEARPGCCRESVTRSCRATRFTRDVRAQGRSPTGASGSAASAGCSEVAARPTRCLRSVCERSGASQRTIRWC